MKSYKTKLIILLTILFAISPAYAANWEIINNKSNNKIYFDLQNVVINNALIFYWSKYKILKTWSVSDCNVNQFAILTTLKYDSNGKLISKKSKDVNSLALEPIVPDSIAESIHNYACKIYFKNTDKWNELMISKENALKQNDSNTAFSSLKEAIDESLKLKKQGYGEKYFIESVKATISLAESYKNQGMLNEAMFIYDFLGSAVDNEGNYDLKNEISSNRQEIKSKIFLIQRQEEEKQEKIKQQQSDITAKKQFYQSQNPVNALNSIFQLLRY